MTRCRAVSVIVPTFNRAEFLPHCLDSILSQTLPASEIIVIDDGSDDATAEVLQRYENRIQVIRKGNGGKSTAVNAGLLKARGDFVWILDDDDVAIPDALERFTEPLAANAEIGFSYSEKYACYSMPDGSLGPVFGVKQVPDAYDRSFAVRLMRRNFLGAASMMVRRSVYDELGGYDEGLLRSQDYEMAIRIALHVRGARVKGGPTFYHRKHEGDRGPLSERFPARDRVRKWQKYNGIFIRRLYRHVPLDVYAADSSVDEDVRRIVGLLQRAHIMASHGLSDLVLNDIRLLSEIRYHGSIPEAAPDVGCKMIWRFVASRGAVRDLRDVLAGGKGVVRTLFRRMRSQLIPAVVWYHLPAPAQRWIRRTGSIFAGGSA